jgi:hypothetical protein
MATGTSGIIFALFKYMCLLKKDVDFDKISDLLSEIKFNPIMKEDGDFFPWID